jgi:hypothetical protein
MQIDWDSRFWRKVHPEALSRCWLWHAAVNKHGYGRFRVRSPVDGKHALVLSHRHAYELAHGTIPEGMVVRHKCDVTACVNPDHLEVGTMAENQRDMSQRGRSTRGERSASAKLTEAQVIDIRARYASGGRSLRSLAAESRVSERQIRNIISRRQWRTTGGQ